MIHFFYRQERKKYYSHREKARSQPQKYITIIIDGMDQNKTDVPSLLQETKSSCNLYRLRTHLSGAIVHTQSPSGKLFYAFYDILQWPHESNLVLQVLSHILHRKDSKQFVLAVRQHIKGKRKSFPTWILCSNG